MTTAQGTKEFTVHVPIEYDYRFSTESKDEIINVLKVVYIMKTNGENLPIFGISKTSLQEFTTTEKDKAKGRSRFPPITLRMWSCDLIKEKRGTSALL